MKESAMLTWQDHALCVRVGDPELWDGVRTSRSHYAGRDFSEAKKVCDECPVSRLCLETALESRDTGCMRGGKTPDELQALLRIRQRAIRKPRRELVAA